MTNTHMRCQQCGTAVQVRVRDGDGVWTVFCSPEHAHAWQEPRSEDEIIAQTNGPGMPYDRCQWCACTLKSGWHGQECPVRAVSIKAQAASS